MMNPLNLDKILKMKVKFATGNEAAVFGALLAGCRFFAGYPITPATEIMENMAYYLPLLDGFFLQMEDEIASIASIIGASWNGFRTMTATSGPGFSLMQENIGYACMTETPCVIVDVQRSGPSTGQPTQPAQGDVMQARWGTHGDHSIIVLCPTSVQETLDLIIVAFNFADKYRTPVIFLTDAYVAHMREKLIIPLQKDVQITPRVKVTIDKAQYHPFRTGFTRPSKVPEMDRFGDIYHTHVTGLTHNWKAHPITDDPNVHAQLVTRFYEKISENRSDIVITEEKYTEDAEILVVSYGISARSSFQAVLDARAQGIKAGFLKLLTIWPFANEQIARLSEQVRAMIVPELNLGQIYHEVAENACGNCHVVRFPKIGGKLHSPQQIFNEIKKWRK
ncbi:MAG TPA: 2-oxoacid:acceptor oxidoreductase subunit alpha [Candidatus Deferrimicrobium sp.]|nr:2-oxoacid:acceptor oxidoreductase subunit alpha [Candidatus Deferrimicrobium sp.]